MVNTSKLSLVKSATVALGLVDEGKMVPKELCGTGFIINKNRYVITASHVIDQCFKWYEIFKSKNEKTEIVAFNSEFTQSEIKFHVLPLDPFSEHSIAKTHLSKASDGYAGPSDADIAVGKFLVRHDDLPFLEIKKPEKLNLYDEIVMCGYPSGDQSLDLKRKFSGIRFSPIMQFGKISGLMPSDNSPEPYGVQTDIVGTGGSSGSPIVDPEEGNVIGIAQQVILAGVNTNDKSIYGTARVGLVYGVTNHLLYKLTENVSAFLEKGEKIPIKINITHFGPATFSYKK